VALHNATRERLAVEEGAHSRTRVEFQQWAERLEGELVAEKRAVAERLAAREQEFESRRDLVDQVQQGYVQRIAELEMSLAQIQANCQSTGDDLRARNEDVGKLRAQLNEKDEELGRVRAELAESQHGRETAATEYRTQTAAMEQEIAMLRADSRLNEFVLESFRSLVQIRCQPSTAGMPTTQLLHPTQSFPHSEASAKRLSFYSHSIPEYEPSVMSNTSMSSMSSTPPPLSPGPSIYSATRECPHEGRSAMASHSVDVDECYQERESVLLYQVNTSSDTDTTVNWGKRKLVSKDSLLIDSHTPIKPKRPLASIRREPIFKVSNIIRE